MKDFCRLDILLFLLLITSIISINPYKKKFFSKNGNLTTDFNQLKYIDNYYNYDDYNRYHKFVCCPGLLFLGAFLLSLWIALLVLYFLVNRKKKEFTVEISRKENNLYGYLNV